MTDLLVDGDGREYWRTSDGTVYGYVENGKIFLTPEGFNSTTLVHEYTHLWARAMMQANPEAWASVKDLLRDTPLWNVVRNDMNYQNIHNNEDLLCSEVLARYSGRNNAARLRREFEKEERLSPNIKEGFLNRVRNAFGKFWGWVGKDIFHLEKFSTISEVTDRILYDMLGDTEVNNIQNVVRQRLVFSAQDVSDGFSSSVSDIDCGVLSLDGCDFLKEVTGISVNDRQLFFDSKDLSGIVSRHFNETAPNRQSLTAGDVGYIMTCLSRPDDIAVVRNDDSFDIYFISSDLVYRKSDSQFVAVFSLDKNGSLEFSDYFHTQTPFKNELSFAVGDDRLSFFENSKLLMFELQNDCFELCRNLSVNVESRGKGLFFDNDAANDRTGLYQHNDDGGNSSLLVEKVTKRVLDNYVEKDIVYSKPVTVGDILRKISDERGFENISKYLFVSDEKQKEARLMSLAESGMAYVAESEDNGLKNSHVRINHYNEKEVYEIDRLEKKLRSLYDSLCERKNMSFSDTLSNVSVVARNLKKFQHLDKLVLDLKNKEIFRLKVFEKTVSAFISRHDFDSSVNTEFRKNFYALKDIFDSKKPISEKDFLSVIDNISNNIVSLFSDKHPHFSFRLSKEIERLKNLKLFEFHKSKDLLSVASEKRNLMSDGNYDVLHDIAVTLSDLKKIKINFDEFGKDQKQNVFFVNNEVFVNKNCTDKQLVEELFSELERRTNKYENFIVPEILKHFKEGFGKKNHIEVYVAPKEKIDLLRKLNLPSNALSNEYRRVSGRKHFIRKPDGKNSEANLIMAGEKFIGRINYFYKYDNNVLLINKELKHKIDRISGIDSDWYGQSRTRNIFEGCVKSAVVTLLSRGKKIDFFTDVRNFNEFNDAVVDEFRREWVYQKQLDERKKFIRNNTDVNPNSLAPVRKQEVMITESKFSAGLNPFIPLKLDNCCDRPFTVNLKDIGFTNDCEYHFNCVEQGFQALKLLVSGGDKKINKDIWRKVFSVDSGVDYHTVPSFVEKNISFSSEGLDLWKQVRLNTLEKLIFCSFEQNENQLKHLFSINLDSVNNFKCQNNDESSFLSERFPYVLKKVCHDLSVKYPATYKQVQKELNLQKIDKTPSQKF